MRPIELELQWFGQYTTAQRVAFDQLDSVFLITGETGSGKTTLFDAMTYALYGRGLGARSSADSLRSQLAGDEDSSKVRFRFETNGVVWEVARSHYHFLRRKRTGTVEVDKFVTLERISGDGARETIPPGQVTQRLLSVVGLKYEDFSKILVLPQGEFQQFLAMSSKDRATLLKTIFPVSRHSELARIAKESVREVGKRADELEAAAKEVGRGFDEVNYPALEGEQVARLSDLMAAEASRLADARAAQQTLQDARILAERIAAKVARVADRDRHEGTRPEQAGRQRRLDEGRRAAVAMPIIERAEALRGDIARISTLLSDAGVARGKATEACDAIKADAEALPARTQRLQEALLASEQLGGRLGDLRALKKALDEQAVKTSAAERATTAIEPARAAVTQAEAAVSALDVLAAERETLAPEVAAADRRVQDLRLLEGDAKTCEQWNNELRPKGEAAIAQDRLLLASYASAETEAETTLAAARAHLEADAAALVAATLRPGQPCAACGSLDHPHPRTGATGEGDAGAAVRLAEQAATNARHACQAQSRVVSEVVARLDAARAVAAESAQKLLQAGHVDAVAWKSAFDAARAALTPLKAREADLARRLSERPALAAKADAARQTVEKLVTSAQTAQNALAAATGAVTAAWERVGEVADLGAELLSVEARQRAAQAANHTEADAMAALQAKWNAAAAAVLAAETKVQTLTAEHGGKVALLPAAESGAAEALRDARFDSAEQARAAAVTPQALDDLQKEVSAWERTLASLTEVIAEHEREIAGRAPPDLPAVEGAAALAVAAADGAADLRRDAENELAKLRATKARLAEIRAEKDQLLADKQGLLTLSKHLNGEVPPKIDFPTWMLTWWLERVLNHANVRMHLLSDSRYAFRLRTEVRDNRKVAGLDVDVLDTWSNQLRDVNALSGGEKFLASLSLALGLADVVQGLNGGVQLNTLFIDEGFGSLDAATLERAMDLVNQIAETRAVGVISHVEALQKAIASQIRVTKSPGGSVARVV